MELSTTDKMYTNDIDLFTVFDGVKTDELKMKNEIDNIIDNLKKNIMIYVILIKHINTQNI